MKGLLIRGENYFYFYLYFKNFFLKCCYFGVWEHWFENCWSIYFLFIFIFIYFCLFLFYLIFIFIFIFILFNNFFLFFKKVYFSYFLFWCSLCVYGDYRRSFTSNIKVDIWWKYKKSVLYGDLVFITSLADYFNRSIM